jgi:hypothetical protein
MGAAEIIALIIGVLKFPQVILDFVKLLQKTPAEKHSDLIKKVQAEAAHFEETGRPQWD